jgi:hypothetical protein
LGKKQKEEKKKKIVIRAAAILESLSKNVDGYELQIY